MEVERDNKFHVHRDILMSVFSNGIEDYENSLSWLASCALVNREWNAAANVFLYRDISKICRHNGFYVPQMIATLKAKPQVAVCVQRLDVTSVLEGAFYSDTLLRYEGDVFAKLIQQTPNLKYLTVANFEVASKERVINAMRRLPIQKFTIRLYLESERRSAKFARLISYFDWEDRDVQTLLEVLPAWDRLSSFKVTHQPDAYHVKPDAVLHASIRLECMPRLSTRLTSLVLRETKIDDATLFHLIGDSRLKTLSLMSCQGITSSAITKQGLARALRMASDSVQDLTIMTPWFDARQNTENLVLDDALRFCSALKRLTVCGFDVTDAFLDNLPPCVRLEHLGVTDFELVTFRGIRRGFKSAVLENLKTLAIWQRNGGVSLDGRRLTQGWISQLFEANGWDILNLLSRRQVQIATAWESRLLSGGDITFHEPFSIARTLTPDLLPTMRVASRFGQPLRRLPSA